MHDIQENVLKNLVDCVMALKREFLKNNNNTLEIFQIYIVKLTAITKFMEALRQKFAS